jgi:hypothetical protein
LESVLKNDTYLVKRALLDNDDLYQKIDGLPMIVYALEHDFRPVAMLIIDKSPKLDQFGPEPEFKSPLYVATYMNDIQVLEKIFEKAPGIKDVKILGHSCIIHALEKEYDDVSHLLIQNLSEIINPETVLMKSILLHKYKSTSLLLDKIPGIADTAYIDKESIYEYTTSKSLKQVAAVLIKSSKRLRARESLLEVQRLVMLAVSLKNDGALRALVSVSKVPLKMSKYDAGVREYLESLDIA